MLNASCSWCFVGSPTRRSYPSMLHGGETLVGRSNRSAPLAVQNGFYSSLPPRWQMSPAVQSPAVSHRRIRGLDVPRASFEWQAKGIETQFTSSPELG